MATESSGLHIDGKQLRLLRKLGGDNLVTFAAKCGITFQYLSQIERGDRKSVSPAAFVAICDALGLEKEDRVALVEQARPKRQTTAKTTAVKARA